ncbi:MAG: 6-carboxytetrahydropterin synthase [Desulfobacterales bacterium]|jgi:6-pyruvoyltetrahydropterin/6-carboxytetrahydropterin synthase
MYTVAVRRDFIAQHQLVGGDWGSENERHTHHYVVEARCHGEELDRHGYLIDICVLEERLDRLVDYFRDADLNRLPEFKGLNPSIENFARIVCLELGKHIDTVALSALGVKIWENEIAWAEYRNVF